MLDSSNRTISERIARGLIAAAFVSTFGFAATTATAECTTWVGADPLVGCTEAPSYSSQCPPRTRGYWEVEYDLTGSEFETRNTLLGAADAIHVIGPGTMTIRYESDGLGIGGGPRPDGTAQIVQLELTQHFVVETRVLGFRAQVATRVNATLPDDRWDGNPMAPIGADSGRGMLDGDRLELATPGIRGYRVAGSVVCEGNGCRFARLARDVPTRIDDGYDVVPLRQLWFEPGGPAHGAGFISNEIALPADKRADPYLRLVGRESDRTYIAIAAPAEATASGSGPCYSVLGPQTEPVEAYAGTK